MTLEEQRDLDECGPAAFTNLVSSIYHLSPENPFNLAIQSQRQRSPADPRPRFPCMSLSDFPLDEGLALCLWYGSRDGDGNA